MRTQPDATERQPLRRVGCTSHMYKVKQAGASRAEWNETPGSIDKERKITHVRIHAFFSIQHCLTNDGTACIHCISLCEPIVSYHWPAGSFDAVKKGSDCPTGDLRREHRAGDQGKSYHSNHRSNTPCISSRRQLLKLKFYYHDCACSVVAYLVFRPCKVHCLALNSAAHTRFSKRTNGRLTSRPQSAEAPRGREETQRGMYCQKCALVVPGSCTISLIKMPELTPCSPAETS
jgi:hypothetical protein